MSRPSVFLRSSRNSAHGSSSRCSRSVLQRTLGALRTEIGVLDGCVQRKSAQAIRRGHPPD
jgi:hypothetical protein